MDLPGNKDRKGEVEVMMVSYILNVCFKSVQKARFIIVINNNDYKSRNGT